MKKYFCSVNIFSFRKIYLYSIKIYLYSKNFYFHPDFFSYKKIIQFSCKNFFQ